MSELATLSKKVARLTIYTKQEYAFKIKQLDSGPPVLDVYWNATFCSP